MIPKVRKYGRIDKSGLLIPVAPRLEDEDWTIALRDYPCVITGGGPCDPAHIRWGLGGGASRKPDDNRVLPVLPRLHQWSHQHGEVRMWRENMTDELMMRALLALADQMHREFRK
jgi:hypothetical protein